MAEPTLRDIASMLDPEKPRWRRPQDTRKNPPAKDTQRIPRDTRKNPDGSTKSPFRIPVDDRKNPPSKDTWRPPQDERKNPEAPAKSPSFQVPVDDRKNPAIPPPDFLSTSGGPAVAPDPLEGSHVPGTPVPGMDEIDLSKLPAPDGREDMIEGDHVPGESGDFDINQVMQQLIATYNPPAAGTGTAPDVSLPTTPMTGATGELEQVFNATNAAPAGQNLSNLPPLPPISLPAGTPGFFDDMQRPGDMGGFGLLNGGGSADRPGDTDSLSGGQAQNNDLNPPSGGTRGGYDPVTGMNPIYNPATRQVDPNYSGPTGLGGLPLTHQLAPTPGGIIPGGGMPINSNGGIGGGDTSIPPWLLEVMPPTKLA